MKYYPDLSAIDLEDPRYPTAICSTCYSILYAHERGNNKKLLPKLHCYFNHTHFLITRGSCQNCPICCLAKSNPFNKYTCEPCPCNNCNSKNTISTDIDTNNNKKEEKYLLSAGS